MRILLVDDEPEVLSIIGQWLRTKGHSPVAIRDPREAMELIASQQFDLICLDLMMPHINGLQLIPEVRERNPELPILVISAVDDIRIGVYAPKKGIEDYLLKPIDFNKLEAILKRLAPES